MLKDRPLLHDLTAAAVSHLHSLGIEPELTVSPFVHDDQLDAFEAEFGLTLPNHVRDIYAETDGFNVSWRSEDSWGNFTFPTLYGGGDLMCVDCSSGRIVEFDHEWGNLNERNGTVYAADLHSYIRSCARISFHSVWLVDRSQVLLGEQCWADWRSVRVPPRYVVVDIDLA